MAEDKKDKISTRVLHPGKTREDYMPVEERPRVIAWHKRLAEVQANPLPDPNKRQKRK